MPMRCILHGADKTQQQLWPEGVSLSPETLDSDACKSWTAFYSRPTQTACMPPCSLVRAIQHLVSFDRNGDGSVCYGGAMVHLADILRASASSKGGTEGSAAESASALGRRSRGGHRLQLLPGRTNMDIDSETATCTV